jgi:hypothetical protein
MDEEARPDPRDLRRPEEFSAAVADLTPEDMWKLKRIALGLRRSAYLDWNDLLHTACERVLTEGRPWPCNQGLVPFLAGVMLSLADTEKKSAALRRGLGPARDTAGHTADAADVVSSRGKVVVFTSAPLTPEDLLIGVEEEAAETEKIAGWRREFLALFEDDYDAQIMIEGILEEGLEGEELRALTGLDPTAFATKRRKVQRRRLKFEAERRQS